MNKSRLKTGRLAVLSGILLSICGVVFAASPDDAGNRAKARYYYMAGAEAASYRRYGEAYTLYKKAYEADTTYSEAAYAYGQLRRLLPLDTVGSTAEWQESMRLCRKLVDAYPGDIALSTDYVRSLANNYGADLFGAPAVKEIIRVLERMDGMETPNNDYLLNLAEGYVALGMTDSVMSVLNRYERREGKSFELLSHKVYSLFKTGAPERGAAEISAYRRDNPKDERALVLMSMLKYSSQDIDSALVYLREAEVMNPDNSMIKAQLATLLDEKGDSIGATQKTYEAIIAPQGEFMDKLEMLRDYLRTLPRELNPEERKTVDSMFQALHTQYPQEGDLYTLEGAVEVRNKNFEEAEDLLRRAVGLQPEDVQTRISLISMLMMQKRESEALDEIKSIWEVTGPVDDLGSLGVYLANKQRDFATSEYLLTTTMQELAPDLGFDRPLDLQDQALLKLGYEDLMKLLSLYQLAGDTYHLTGDTEKMRICYENVLAVTPDAPLPLNNYAYYLALEGRDLDKAEEMVRRAIAGEPENPSYTDTLGWILFLRGDLAGAKEWMEKTMALYETKPEQEEESGDEPTQADPAEEAEAEEGMTEFLTHYGIVLWSLGEHKEAKAQWERALKASPDDEKLKQYIREGYK